MAAWDYFSEQIAARTVWGEARGQSNQVMVAVAYVIMNRVADGRWGSTPASVCLAPYQFSCWNVGDPNRDQILGPVSVNDPTLPYAEDAFDEASRKTIPDPTHGATFYYASGSPVPAWAQGKTPVATIGPFLFFKDIA